MKYSKALIIGSTGFVTNIYVNKLDDPNLEKSIGKSPKSTYLGGTGLTIAHGLRSIHNGAVELITAVGKDDFEKISELLYKNGINPILYSSEGSKTGSGVVVTDRKGSQKWISFDDTAARNVKDLSLHGIADSNTLAILSPIHTSFFNEARRQLTDLECDYIYDPGMLLNFLPGEELIEGIKHARILVANDSEWKVLGERFGITPRLVMENGQTAIRTRAEKGVQVFDSGRELSIPAFNTRVIDPTGAGDMWRSGLIAGLVNNLGLQYSCELANALASISVENKSAIDFEINSGELLRRIDMLQEQETKEFKVS